MTTTKLIVNSLQEESTVSVNKRVWVKPTVEIISVESGGPRTLYHEAQVFQSYKVFYHS